MNKKKISVLFVIGAACMWGTLGVTVRVLSSFGFSAIQIVAARLAVSAVLLGSYLLVTDKSRLRIEKKDIKWFIGTGIFSMLFFNTCYCLTVSKTSLSVAAVLLYISPIFVTVLSAIIFKEKITRKKILAMLFSVAGCALVSGVLQGNSGRTPAIGIILGICAAFGYALYGIFAKILVQKYHSLTILFYTFLLAGLGGVFIGDTPKMIRIMMSAPVSVPTVIGTALLCSVIPYILYTTALKHIEASKVSIVASIEPVVATVLGVLVFRESLTLTSMAGIICVLAAIGILNMGE